MSDQAKHFYAFGPFRLDPKERVLLRGGQPLALNPKAVETLLVLVQNAGHLVDKDELMKKVWPDAFVEEGNLAKNVFFLRKVLGRGDDGREYIETVPRRGYRFVARVETWSGEDEATGVALEDRSWHQGPADKLTRIERIDRGRAYAFASQPEPIWEEPQRAALPGPAEKAASASPELRPAPQVPAPIAPVITNSLPLPAVSTGGKPASRSLPRRIWWVLAIAVALAVVLAVIRPTPTPQLVRIAPLTHSGAVHPNQKLLTDGPRLYFLERTNGRLVPKSMPASGGTGVPIVLPFSVDLQDISPDGSELLIRELGEQYVDVLWSISSAGGAPRRLGIVGINAATFTRDGRALLYSKGATVFTCDRDGSNSRRLATLPGEVLGMSMSPQGDRLRFFLAQEPDEGVVLWESGGDGSDLHRVIKDWPQPRWELGESWSPDGRWFTFSAPRGDAGREVWLLGEPGLLRRRPLLVPLTSGPIDFGRPVFSRDGKRIFVTGETRRGELLRYDFTKREFTQFLGGISADSVAFSPDKQWLMYVSFPEGTLWRSRADGSEPVALTIPPLRAGRADYSPDGSKIAFEGRSTRNAHWNIYVIPSTGGIPEQVAKDTDRSGFTWRRDSQSLIIGNPDESAPLQVVDLEWRSIMALPGTVHAIDPALSPSGRYLVARMKGSLVMFDLTTQRKKQSAADDAGIGYPRWSADERYVSFNRFQNAAPAFYRVRIADGFTARLMQLTQFSATDSWGCWSTIMPDGSLLLLRGFGGTDLYALDWSER